jgi:hypothetical protein
LPKPTTPWGFLHPSCPKPTALLALVALCIVKRLKPAWTVIEIQEAAAELSLSAERVSRVATRAVALFEPIVAKLTRRGRPPQDGASDEVEGQLASPPHEASSRLKRGTSSGRQKFGPDNVGDVVRIS